MARPIINIQGGMCEFLGAYLFLFIINSVGSNKLSSFGLLGVAVGIGVGLSIIVSIMAGVSGGCINPAVSLAVYLSDTKALSLYDLLIHIIAQIFGGFLGALTSYGVVESTFAFTPQPGFGYRQVVGSEIVMSAMLCYTVLAVAMDGGGEDTGGLFIGLVVTVGILAVGPVSGACFNPAVAFGINVVNAIDGKTFYAKDFFTYFLCPFAGSLIAVVLFLLTRWNKYMIQNKRNQLVDGEKEGAQAPVLKSRVLPKSVVYKERPESASKPGPNSTLSHIDA